ncbi:MAG: hypothetical protein ACRCT4_13495 [Silvania sp.]
MNLSNIYSNLIVNALAFRGTPRSIKIKKRGYVLHHITPCAFFPSKRKDNEAHKPTNLVYVTVKEHYLAHHLLARIHGDVMAYAYKQMIKRPMVVKSTTLVKTNKSRNKIARISLEAVKMTKQGRASKKDFKALLVPSEQERYKQLIEYFYNSDRGKKNGKRNRAIKKAQNAIMFGG